MNDRRPKISVGGGILTTASTLDPFDTPCREKVCPRYSTEGCAKSHFYSLHRSPFS